MARESGPARAERFGAVVGRLRATYPGARIALVHRDAYELLVCVLLAAQCTDARVNEVTPALFARFPDPRALSRAEAPELERLIARLGLFRTKARHLAQLGRVLVEQHGGEVPRARETLATLPGVGWKTAGVVAVYAFDEPSFPVDTHVGRLSRRLGLTAETRPERVEAALSALLPPALWGEAHQLLVSLGRGACRAVSPACDACPVETLCPRAGVARSTKGRPRRSRPS